MKGIYCGSQTDEVRDIIVGRADEEGVPLKLFGRDFEVSDVSFLDNGMSCTVTVSGHRYENLEITLMGSAQCRNLALALQAAEDIIGEGFLQSDEDMDRLRAALKGLNWFGRLSLLSRDPFILVDCCINRASAGPAMEVLKELGIKKAVVILVIPDDKDYLGVAKAMEGISKTIILTKSQNVHYVFTNLQQEDLEQHNIESTWIDTVEGALNKAKALGGPTVILGTTSVVSEVCKIYEKQRTKTN